MSAPRGRRGLEVPAGYEVVQREGGILAIMRSDHQGLVSRRSVLDPERILREKGVAGGGRGRIARLPVRPSGFLVLKKYRRGGLFGELLPDLFPGVGRMLADLAASERARTHAVPCAPAVGLILRRRWGGLWSGYLLSEEIPGARGLASVLAAAGPGGAFELARRAVRGVRRLHDAGIVHRDLNLGNLLVRDAEIFIIDLDGARIRPAVAPADRLGNLFRLDRSYVKSFGGAGPLSPQERRELLAVYCGEDDSLLSAARSRIRRHKRSLAMHRLSWR